MTNKQALKRLKSVEIRNALQEDYDALDMAIKALEQEPCDDVCEWFEQYVDIATDIVELRFSDGTVKRVKRGLYMRDIEKSIRKMLIDQIANEKKQEPCEDAISRQAVIERLKKEDKILYTTTGLNYLVRAIEEIPSVSTEKTGHWIDNSRDGYTQYYCSCCCDSKSETSIKSNYCPNCGAKMEVEE